MKPHRQYDPDGPPVPGMADFLDRLEAKLAKRNSRTARKLLAWGELLDAAGWCVALRLAEGEFWLSERAMRAFESPGVPARWDEVLVRLESISPGLFRVESAGVRIWSAAEAGPPEVPSARLTRREAEVLHWLREGKTCPEMALILGCALRTVEKHVENLYRKIGAHDRAAVILGGGTPR